MNNLIGVTGGIGAGKSTVLAYLDRLGCRTLDSDAVVHRLYQAGGELASRLRARWGAAVMQADGAVDRQAVASRVFAAPAELRWLNETVHPAVKLAIEREAAAAPSPLFCAIPLLFEVGWEVGLAGTVAVWCDPSTQLRRLHQRGWCQAEIDRRRQAQLSMDEKLERAEFGLINSASMDFLGRQVALLLPWR